MPASKKIERKPAISSFLINAQNTESNRYTMKAKELQEEAKETAAAVEATETAATGGNPAEEAAAPMPSPERAREDVIAPEEEKRVLVVRRAKVETRSETLMIRIQPSLKARAETQCKRYGVSVSEAIHQLFEKWLNETEG